MRRPYERWTKLQLWDRLRELEGKLDLARDKLRLIASTSDAAGLRATLAATAFNPAHRIRRPQPLRKDRP